jgi:hypothetical protein
MTETQPPATIPASSEPTRFLDRWASGLGVFVLFWLIYLASGAARMTGFNAHVYLADAFWHGRFDLIHPPGYFELAHVGDRAYVAYGIGPTLLMMPFIRIWGLAFHQAMFSAGLAAAAVALWWSVVGRSGVTGQLRVWLTALFGLGSLMWYYGGQSGNTWALMHVTTVFGLVVALWELYGRRRGWLVGLGFGIAALSRQPVLLSAPFFVGMLWRGSDGIRPNVRTQLGFALAVGLLLAIDAWYNWGRFGSPFENGYKQVIYATTSPALVPYGLFSLNYLKQNLVGYFLKLPERLGHFPWFDPTVDGFSLFLSLPALVLAVRADWRDRQVRLAALAIASIMAMYLVYYWSGFAQFGRRYTVDFLPFAMLLILNGTRQRLGPVVIISTLLGALVELWGLFWWGMKGW